jgi:hypothetical protein
VVVGMLSQAGPLNVAAALRRHARDPFRPLATLGMTRMNPTSRQKQQGIVEEPTVHLSPAETRPAHNREPDQATVAVNKGASGLGALQSSHQRHHLSGVAGDLGLPEADDAPASKDLPEERLGEIVADPLRVQAGAQQEPPSARTACW